MFRTILCRRLGEDVYVDNKDFHKDTKDIMTCYNAEKKGQRSGVLGSQNSYRPLDNRDIKMSTKPRASVVSVNLSGQLNSKDSLQTKKSS